MATRVCGTSSERDVDRDEADDRRHAQEVHQARGLEIVEQREQLGELHRLPDREAGQHDQHAGHEHADVEHALHRVVLGRVVVGEVQPQRVAHIGDEVGQPDRQQHAVEPPGDEAVGQVGEAVEKQDPHAEEVPLQAVLRPRAERDGVGEMQPAEDHLVVVDLPAAVDHDEHRDRVGPVHDADR
jgi:hypothetical protein